MANIASLLSSVATLLVSFGAVVVLFKTATLIAAISDHIEEREA